MLKEEEVEKRNQKAWNKFQAASFYQLDAEQNEFWSIKKQSSNEDVPVY